MYKKYASSVATTIMTNSSESGILGTIFSQGEDDLHPGYIPTLGKTFRDVVGTKEFKPETKVYFTIPIEEGEDSPDNCLCCGDLRIGCDVCYKGDCISVDVHHPRPNGPEEAVALKELDVRILYHWRADGSLLYSEEERKNAYEMDKQCRVRNWYVSRNPSDELRKRVFDCQLPNYRDRYDTAGRYSHTSQLGGRVKNFENFVGIVRLCVDCHAWFFNIEPTLAQGLMFMRGREEAYMVWLEEHQANGSIKKVE